MEITSSLLNLIKELSRYISNKDKEEYPDCYCTYAECRKEYTEQFQTGEYKKYLMPFLKQHHPKYYNLFQDELNK